MRCKNACKRKESHQETRPLAMDDGSPEKRVSAARLFPSGRRCLYSKGREGGGGKKNDGRQRAHFDGRIVTSCPLPTGNATSVAAGPLAGEKRLQLSCWSAPELLAPSAGGTRKAKSNTKLQTVLQKHDDNLVAASLSIR